MRDERIFTKCLHELRGLPRCCDKTGDSGPSVGAPGAECEQRPAETGHLLLIVDCLLNDTTSGRANPLVF